MASSHFLPQSLTSYFPSAVCLPLTPSLYLPLSRFMFGFRSLSFYFAVTHSLPAWSVLSLYTPGLYITPYSVNKWSLPSSTFLSASPSLPPFPPLFCLPHIECLFSLPLPVRLPFPCLSTPLPCLPACSLFSSSLERR